MSEKRCSRLFCEDHGKLLGTRQRLWHKRGDAFLVRFLDIKHVIISNLIYLPYTCSRR